MYTECSNDNTVKNKHNRNISMNNNNDNTRIYILYYIYIIIISYTIQILIILIYFDTWSTKANHLDPTWPTLLEPAPLARPP